MFANTQMRGMDTGFPDVCLTSSPAGPVPILYPNITAGPMGVPAAYNVLFMCAPAHNIGTSSPMTNGDNAGVASTMVAKLVETIAERVSTSSKTSSRTVTELDQLHAGIIDHQAAEAVHLAADKVLINGGEIAKVEAGQIHLG